MDDIMYLGTNDKVGISLGYEADFAEKIVKALNNKVDKDGDKVLSDNNYTDEEKEKLAGLSNYDDEQIKADLNNKVDKDGDKVLTDNNYDDTDKSKINNILYFADEITDADGWSQLDTIKTGFGVFKISNSYWNECVSNALISGDFRQGSSVVVAPTSGATPTKNVFVIIGDSYSSNSSVETYNSVSQTFFDGDKWYRRKVKRTESESDTIIDFMSTEDDTTTITWTYNVMTRIDTVGKELTSNKITSETGLSVESTDDNYPSAKAVVDYVLDNGGKANVITSITDTLILADRQDAQLGELTALTLSMPDEVSATYKSDFSFISGETATVLTYSATPIIWRGEDCDGEGAFVPEANTMYEISVKYVNTKTVTADDGTETAEPVIVARVGVV